MPTLTRHGRYVDVLVDMTRCRSCDLCVKLCPEDVFITQAPLFKAVVERIADCTGCRLCEFLCPDWAIDVRVGAAAAPEAA